MMEFKVISCLLEYPSEGIWQAKSEILNAVEQLDALTVEQRQRLKEVVEWRVQGELLDAQSEYSELFDRGRATSLLLFEHVHGESRDRGQAMIDLLEQYRQVGLEIDSCELPDHLPLFLEFLSTLPTEDAQAWLQDIAAILALLGARLQQRESGYAPLFDLLIELSGSNARSSNLAQQVSQEARDDTAQALDAVWEEEQVKFMATEGCEDSDMLAHQRRFSGAVAPQYLSLDSAVDHNGRAN